VRGYWGNNHGLCRSPVWCCCATLRERHDTGLLRDDSHNTGHNDGPYRAGSRRARQRSQAGGGGGPDGGGGGGAARTLHHLVRIRPAPPSRQRPFAGIWTGELMLAWGWARHTRAAGVSVCVGTARCLSWHGRHNSRGSCGRAGVARHAANRAVPCGAVWCHTHGHRAVRPARFGDHFCGIRGGRRGRRAGGEWPGPLPRRRLGQRRPAWRRRRRWNPGDQAYRCSQCRTMHSPRVQNFIVILCAWAQAMGSMPVARPVRWGWWWGGGGVVGCLAGVPAATAHSRHGSQALRQRQPRAQHLV
jgi:hypothetical protein